MDEYDTKITKCGLLKIPGINAVNRINIYLEGKIGDLCLSLNKLKVCDTLVTTANWLLK